MNMGRLESGEDQQDTYYDHEVPLMALPNVSVNSSPDVQFTIFDNLTPQTGQPVPVNVVSGVPLFVADNQLTKPKKKLKSAAVKNEAVVNLVVAPVPPEPLIGGNIEEATF